MTTPVPLVRKDNPKIAVVGTLECVPGVALVSGAILDEAQRLELEYGGETRVDWDGQRPVLREGQRIFVDERGAQISEADVALLDDGRLVQAQWRPAPSAAHAIEPMLVLSTAHVRPATMLALQVGAGGVAPYRVIVHEFGVILYVGETAPCSADLGAPLALARAHGCVWLNLDGGAAELDRLATYDWPEAGHAD